MVHVDIKWKKSKKIEKNRFMVFSVPNIKSMLKNKYTNALNFEHTFYLNEQVIEFFLKYIVPNEKPIVPIKACKIPIGSILPIGR